MVSQRDVPLQPSRLGRIRHRVRVPVRLYEAALAAWALVLAIATLGLVEAGRVPPGVAVSSTAVPRAAADLVLPPVLPALAPKTDAFRTDARL